MSTDQSFPIAIVGAGPTGLEAALACAEVGRDFRVFEVGEHAGSGVAEWGGVRLFTPWEMNLSRRMASALAALGREVPTSACPTGEEFVELGLAPIAALPGLNGAIEYGARVRHIAREGLTKEQEIGTPERASRPFRLIVETAAGERVERASAVIDCSGGRAIPNWSGDGGVPAPGERALAGRIERDIPDLSADQTWRGSRVLLIGAGHSAQTAARDLAAAAAQDGDTRLIWAIRSADPEWGSPPGDPLAERAALAAAAGQIARGAPGVDTRPGVCVDAFTEAPDGIRATLRNGDGAHQVTVDRVLSLTGRVGDHTIYRQLQVHECYATSGPMNLAATLVGAGGDCLRQPAPALESLRNPEPGFFVLGAKSYGRTATYLMRVGYEQVDHVISHLMSYNALASAS